ncbi:hypothetical protein, partial [Streptomyces sp. NPDC055134]
KVRPEPVLAPREETGSHGIPAGSPAAQRHSNPWDGQNPRASARGACQNGRCDNDGRPDASRTVTDLGVTILEPSDPLPALPTASRDDRHTAPGKRRRHRILTLLEEDPTRLGQPRDIAAHFGDVTLETMYRQLNRWAASGLIHKLGPGLYAATAWSPTPLA